jgi:hypothetical protein
MWQCRKCTTYTWKHMMCLYRQMGVYGQQCICISYTNTSVLLASFWNGNLVSNWKVHGWRQMLECDGINWAYIEKLVYNAPNFITGLSNIHHPQSWNPFGHMSKAFPCVIPFRKVNAQNYKSLLQYLCHHAVRGSVQNWWQLQPSCMKMRRPTTETPLRVFYSAVFLPQSMR